MRSPRKSPMNLKRSPRKRSTRILMRSKKIHLKSCLSIYDDEEEEDEDGR